MLGEELGIISLIKERQVELGLSPRGALESIAEEFALRVKYGEYDRCTVNYSMTDTERNDVTDECRGLILRCPDKLDAEPSVIAGSFKRFYNYGEERAASIDWDTAQIQEKLDGSLVTLYFDEADQLWHVATRGTPDESVSAELPQLEGSTFAERVWALLHGVFSRRPSYDPTSLWNRMAFIFEYVGPFNRNVTYYPKEGLILLTITTRLINGTGFYEWSSYKVDALAQQLGFRRPKVFPFREDRSLDYVISLCKTLEDTDEGFVVLDRDKRRVKVKNESYLYLARLTSGITQSVTGRLKALTGAVLSGDVDEISSYFPEYEGLLKDVESQILAKIDELTKLWEEHYPAATRKDFALGVKDHPMSGILFTTLDRVQKGDTELSPRAHIRELVYQMPPEKLSQHLRMPDPSVGAGR